MKALILAGEGFEDMELFYPRYRLIEQGYDVTVAAPDAKPITGKHGYTIKPDTTIAKVKPDAYGLLVIPGGKGPESVRLEKNALAIVSHFMDNGKPVAAICHGAQVLISAGVLTGRKATCWKGISHDIAAAGAEYHDSECVVDGNLVTSRMPDDLPAFMRETLRLAAGPGSHAGLA
jgi:protease I